MPYPRPHPADRPVRILFVFAWLSGGEEETELRLLAQTLDRTRYRLDALPCSRSDTGGDQKHWALRQLGVRVDRTAYDLGFEDTVAYLARKITGYEIVVACQNVPDVVLAYEQLLHCPPLIVYGRTVTEALACPPHLATCYIGASPAVTAAASTRLGDPARARTIRPMIDMSRFASIRRTEARAALGLRTTDLVIGWAASTDELAQTTEAVRAVHSGARFVRIGPATPHGGPTPSAEGTLIESTTDLPDTILALDLLVAPSCVGEMAHIIGAAGAARLPVIVPSQARPPGTPQCGLCHPATVLFVQPLGIASAIVHLVSDSALRQRLGLALHARVVATCSSDAGSAAWAALFEDVLVQPPAPPPSVFRSVVQGGFESSTHCLRDGRRLDMIAATQHDTHARNDYRQLAEMGLCTVRDGLRWHLIEQQQGRFDFSSFLPMVHAAQQSGTQVIWDLMHYGWPDGLDIWTPAFVDRFAAFARAAAQVWRESTDEIPFWCPVNEMSFFAWGGGDVGYLNPFASGRGLELKVQLVRACIAAMRAVRDVDARARLVVCEPLISIHHDPSGSRSRAEAEAYHQAQYEALDMLSGRVWPQIGGEPTFLDLIGVNYYPRNQWRHMGPPIDVDDAMYRPFSDLLFESYARYKRPLFISETGVEDHRRAAWFRYVVAEMMRARRRGVPVEGLCLYPILNHPGWDDDRDCHNGLLTQHFEGRFRGVDADLMQAVAQTVATFGG